MESQRERRLIVPLQRKAEAIEKIERRILIFSAICSQLATDLYGHNLQRTAKYAANKLYNECDAFCSKTYSGLNEVQRVHFEVMEDLYYKDLPGPENKAIVLYSFAKSKKPEVKMYKVIGHWADLYLLAVGVQKRIPFEKL